MTAWCGAVAAVSGCLWTFGGANQAAGGDVSGGVGREPAIYWRVKRPDWA